MDNRLIDLAGLPAVAEIDRPLAVGDLVVNFGIGARVVAVHENGDLDLRETAPLETPAGGWSAWSPATWRAAARLTRRAI